MNCVWLDANKYWANIASAIRGGTLAIAAVLAGTQESEVAVCLLAFRKILSVQSHLYGVTVLLGRSNHPAATVEERCSKTVCFANSRELNLRTVSIERRIPVGLDPRIAAVSNRLPSGRRKTTTNRSINIGPILICRQPAANLA